MDERQIQSQLIALLLPTLALLGLGVAVGFDPYLRRDKKRTLLLIEAIVFTLIVNNCVSIALEGTWKSEYVFLKTCLDVYSYAARPAAIVLFIYNVWDDPRRRLFWIPVGLNAAVFLTALVNDWAFRIDQNGYFFRGRLGYTAHWVSGFLLVSILVVMLRLWARNGGKATVIPLTNVCVAALGPILDAQVHQNGIITFTEITTVYCCVFYYIWLHQQYVREHEQALRAGQRIQLMMSQIQPHFLFNSLEVIRRVYRKVPEKGDDALLKFERYLRGNMDSIGQEGPIPFRTELEHTQTYLELEQLRFPNELSIDYDLQCMDFLLPSLTLQPLAENAVRHGVRGKKSGEGTVKIATREYENRYEVIVTDDGNGFDPNAYPRDGHSHIGLSNVRERLRYAGGELRVGTGPEGGTEAVIIVPKKEHQGGAAQ